MKKVFENKEKYSRAVETVKLVTGKLIPNKKTLEERLNKWRGILQEEKIDVNDTDAAVEFVYKKLAGRILTAEEAEAVEVRKAEAKKKVTKKTK